MNKHENELFEYLINLENYKNAKELTIELQKVDEKLIELFWEKVEIQANKEFKKINLTVELEYNNVDSFNFRFFKKHWNKLVCIGFDDSLDLGIMLRKELYKKSDIEVLESKYSYLKISSENNNWFCYDKIKNSKTLDFKHISSLEHILPEKSDNLVLLIVEEFIKKSNNWISICDEINNYNISKN